MVDEDDAVDPDLMDQHEMPKFTDPSEVAIWAGYQVHWLGRVFTRDELWNLV
ncbi:hypothetical protein [Geodermatophilus sp. Leaf369]|uniref:hypothetical protein n=1 Tax=Geodermatophilus sp. Leaf369 TaxID=1736354 RepID=UPI0012FAB10A|nr:hypothetical protein [Geodermatophilus sp. Leaf369]